MNFLKMCTAYLLTSLGQYLTLSAYTDRTDRQAFLSDSAQSPAFTLRSLEHNKIQPKSGNPETLMLTYDRPKDSEVNRN
jgi:hypothetical protein